MSRHRNLIWCVITLNAVIAITVCVYCIALIPRKHSEQILGDCIQSNRFAEPRTLRKNVFYLKTHKTASSTVQNIIMRFGLRHYLNFLLPTVHNYIGYTEAITYDILDEAMIPVDGKFNILAHHSRYHAASNLYLYDDTIKVTTLRDPPELFESMYQYYGLHKIYRKSLEQLLASLPHANVSFAREKHLKNGYNQMSFDLGLSEAAFDNETAVRQFVDYIDREFDFVMIKEYLEASLVMLADLLGWPLHYVSSLPLLTRQSTSKYQLTSADRIKLAELNRVDTRLYSHFLKKFRARTLRYGVPRLIEEVQKLHAINEELARRCISKKRYRGISKTVTYVLRNESDWECFYSTKRELAFTNELRNRQRNRLKSVKKLYEFANGGDEL